MTQPKQVHYTLEQEPARLVEPGQSLAEVGRSLGVIKQTMGNGVREHRTGTLKGAGSNTNIARRILMHANQ
jgi:transposase